MVSDKISEVALAPTLTAGCLNGHRAKSLAFIFIPEHIVDSNVTLIYHVPARMSRTFFDRRFADTDAKALLFHMHPLSSLALQNHALYD